MSLGPDTIRLVARMLNGVKLSGSAITFGVQHVPRSSYASLAALLGEEAFPFRPLDAADRPERLGELLFRMFGFDTVHSLDYYPDEEPTHQLDLNAPVPDAMRGQYDLVCDGGTAEHCFNVPQALANAVHLLKPGGYVLHVSPTSGWLQHGFYQFCPTLFFDFYSENGFVDLSAKILYEGRSFDVAEYLPKRDFLGRRALLIFVARKEESYDEIRFPIQNAYRARFEGVERRELEERPKEAGRLALLDPRTWINDGIAIGKQYLRLGRHSRRV